MNCKKYQFGDDDTNKKENPNQIVLVSRNNNWSFETILQSKSNDKKNRL